MLLPEFLSRLKQVEKVFLWVEFSENHYGYLNVTKAAVTEFVEGLEVSTDETIYAVEIDYELFVGAPSTEPGC